MNNRWNTNNPDETDLHRLSVQIDVIRVVSVQSF